MTSCVPSGSTVIQGVLRPFETATLESSPSVRGHGGSGTKKEFVYPGLFLIIAAWVLFAVLPAALGHTPDLFWFLIPIMFGIGMHAFVWGFVVELL